MSRSTRKYRIAEQSEVLSVFVFVRQNSAPITWSFALIHPDEPPSI